MPRVRRKSEPPEQKARHKAVKAFLRATKHSNAHGRERAKKHHISPDDAAEIAKAQRRAREILGFEEGKVHRGKPARAEHMMPMFGWADVDKQGCCRP